MYKLFRVVYLFSFCILIIACLPTGVAAATISYDAPIIKTGNYEIQCQVDTAAYGEIGEYEADFDSDGVNETLVISFELEGNDDEALVAYMKEENGQIGAEEEMLSWDKGNCYLQQEINVSIVSLNGNATICAESFGSGTMATGFSTDFEAIAYNGRSFTDVFSYDITGSSFPSTTINSELRKFQNAGFQISSLRGLNFGNGLFVAEQMQGTTICELDIKFIGSDVSQIFQFMNGQVDSVSPFRYTISSVSQIKVVVDNTKLSFDQPPIMDNNRVMVPIRSIFEALGYDVTWNQSTQTGVATNGSNTIRVQVNNAQITYNGGSYWCDVAPKNLSGRILVPVRAISESAGCDVYWDQESQTVRIES